MVSSPLPHGAFSVPKSAAASVATVVDADVDEDSSPSDLESPLAPHAAATTAMDMIRTNHLKRIEPPGTVDVGSP